jgi:hypothetical protein
MARQHRLEKRRLPERKKHRVFGGWTEGLAIQEGLGLRSIFSS